MNYYIKGDKERAEEIKAAFEKKGVELPIRRSCADDGLIYFLLDGDVFSITIKAIELFEKNPDYKELELAVKPKFKVGDWIVRGKGFVYEPSLITEIRDYYICELLNGERVTYTLNDVHKNFHLWTIEDAKNGDVLVLNGKPFIYSHGYGKNYCYIDDCGQFRANFNLVLEGNCVLPATKQERDLLFSKMREVGYEWDADKKKLRKIKSHYDIANFKLFDKVLTRDSKYGKWNINLFSYYVDDEDARVVARFRCMNSLWIQCIPFNEDTKHLLGTADMPSEEYINW